MTSYVHLESGAYERAEEVQHEALALLRTIEPQPFYISALGQLVELYSRWPAPSHAFLARKYADEALLVGEAVKDAESSLMVALSRARVPPHAEALEWAIDALTRALAMGGLPEVTANGWSTTRLQRTPMISMTPRSHGRRLWEWIMRRYEAHGNRGARGRLQDPAFSRPDLLIDAFLQARTAPI